MSGDLNRAELLKGARKMVTCARVKPGESLLIVTDTTMPSSIAESLAEAGREVDADVSVLTVAPLHHHGQEPPPLMKAAIMEADVIFTVLSSSPMHSIGADLVAKKKRALGFSMFTEDLLIKGGVEADFEKQKPIIEKVASLLTDAKKIRVTTPAGADLTANIEGRQGFALTGIVEPGQFCGATNMESPISPQEGTTHGVAVIDGSVVGGIHGMGGLVKEPIRCTIKDGMVTDIEGGEEARRLKAALDDFGDPRAYNVAEIALGLNPKVVPVGRQIVDMGAWGSVHIGMGRNTALGGKVEVPLHFDMIMRDATVELDGKVIMENRELKI